MKSSSSYKPAYYSVFQESLTTLCKNILPFSFKKKGLPLFDTKLNKLQSENLKWQQDSFHQILNLIGLQREGIISEKDVSTFRIHLLDTLIGSPSELQQPDILRDKLVFLQELLYAKCISEYDYHSFKRPLLGRLAAQGAQVKARDVVVDGQTDITNDSEEYWTDIDLRNNNEIPQIKTKPLKQIKGALGNKSYKRMFNREENGGSGSARKTKLSSDETSPFPLGEKSDAYNENRNPNSFSLKEITNKSKGNVSSSFQNPFWNI